MSFIPFDPDAFAQVPSPALLLRPAAVERNIALAVTLAGGAAGLRPHVKTHKCAAIVALTVAAGVRAFKAATAAEAEMAARAGAEEVLLAYPAVGPTLERVGDLRRRYRGTRFQCVFEDEPSLAALAASSAAAGLGPLEVWLDLDCGQHRTGAAPVEAPALLARAAKTEGLLLRGIHAYDGHVHDADLSLRRAAVASCRDLVAGIAAKADLGEGRLDLVVGGTPTFALHAEEFRDRPCAALGRVQASPGTCFLQDGNYASWYPDLPFEAAAAVITRVLRRDAGRRTVTLDAGVKAAAPDASGCGGRLPDHPSARPLGQSEEHWVWEFPEGKLPGVGELLLIQSAHVCPTVALYGEAVLCSESGLPAGVWKINARDRRLSI